MPCTSKEETESQAREPEDGLTREELFALYRGTSLTYDDLIMHPAHVGFGVENVDLSSRLSRNIALKTPLVSSPMDTVTESAMAIALALQGGIGIIHCNSAPEEQARQVAAVKRYNNGFIADPVSVRPDDTVRRVFELRRSCAFSCFPVTADGKAGSRLLGILSDRDLDFVTDESLKVSQVMTPRAEIVTERSGCSLADAFAVVRARKVRRLPIVDADDNLVALICKKDILRNLDFPLASRSSRTNQLLVGAALSTRSGDERRSELLVQAGADVLVIDSANGDSVFQAQLLARLKKQHPAVDVVAGNVATAAQARRLLDAGADGLRVGMGSGSICTTQNVCGVGRGQASAVRSVAALCARQSPPVPVIADGGVRSSGDVLKALALGASAVMAGGLFAGTAETPGECVIRDGLRLKRYKGMGAEPPRAEGGGNSRYLACAGRVFVRQGVVGNVAFKGSVADLVPGLLEAVRQGMQNVGARTVAELGEKARFERRSEAARVEGGVHDLHSYERTGVH